MSLKRWTLQVEYENLLKTFVNNNTQQDEQLPHFMLS